MAEEKDEKVGRSILEAILDSRILPLVEAIKRLEKVQETTVQILQIQARQDQKILHLEEEHKKSDKIHTDLYEKYRVLENKLNDKIGDIKEKTGDRFWEVIKILGLGGAGALVIDVAKALAKAFTVGG